ncbi:MAG: hypothetical protein R2706_05415 [Acidimicrobiales bacterium]
MPYPRERAAKQMADVVAMDGPEDGKGWSVTVVGATEPDRILGDLYVGLRWGGRSGNLLHVSPQLLGARVRVGGRSRRSFAICSTTSAC